MFSKFYLLSLLFLASCALPTPERVDQNFIPEVEIQGASLVNEGLFYFKKSRFFEAEASLRKALYLFPDADNVKASLAVVLQTNEQLDEAVSILSELIKNNPEIVEYKQSLARIYYIEGKYEESENWYREAWLMSVDKMDFLRAATISRSLSTLSFRVGYEEQSNCASEEAFILKPDNEEFVRSLKMKNALGFYQVSRDQVVDWMQKQSLMKDPGLLGELAVLNFSLGDFDEATKFASLAKDLGITDGTQKFELTLLNKFIEAREEKTSSSEDDEEEISEEEILQFKDQLEQITYSPVSLYWPSPFLDEADKLAKSLIAEYGDSEEVEINSLGSTVPN